MKIVDKLSQIEKYECDDTMARRVRDADVGDLSDGMV